MTPPVGSKIWFGAKFDPVSGGILDIDTNPTGNSTNMENINFDASQVLPPPGTYIVCVLSFRREGVDDSYTLEIYEGATLMTSITTNNGGQIEICQNYVYPQKKPV